MWVSVTTWNGFRASPHAICHFLLKVSISNQRKGQGAVGRGNANQPPKEKGGKACHLLFLFVFDIFLWSVGEDRTKASLEESLPHILLVLSPVPTKSREGHVQAALQDALGTG